ncbi:triose-phosphate isomerase [Blochmannia endosymbiont of Camponotus (Colobopsis) obliquus]|uniref:triose-phosphate isomerase n=1 Tax=Blochmannia endosymbiont of Camponotus (Colobopsis) obliquus TaxID=1505597 RepID=UPI00061A8B47|nr:triose-phosphate isomerase [Blochmannia endosymbiont of Camponotus (Colobopsis) obliquus]AKC60739.1 Triosephosphate isomerase [Blochmannia endosymbiont of Camponotus (Colobopsis) obliquus]
MRYPLIISNWKANGSKTMIIDFIHKLQNNLNNNYACNIIIAPPIIYLDVIKQYLINKDIILGAQNVDIHISGSFTGEISANMLKDMGVLYTIIGHYERRIHHKENNEDIIKKFDILKKNHITPILCIGENKEEKIQNKTKTVCIQQINNIINTLGIEILKNSVIAYEPIWAIGSTSSANPNEVQTLHNFIRSYIAQQNIEIAETIHLLYGGSVNTNNAYELLRQKDIDGLLIGKASLDPKNLSEIIKITQKTKTRN